MRYLPRMLLRRSTIVALGSLAFLFGVIIAPWASTSGNWIILSLFLLAVSKRIPLCLLFAVCSFLFVIGSVRGQSALIREQPLVRLYGQKVTVRGVVSEDSYYDAKKRITFQILTEDVLSPVPQRLRAPIRITTYAVTSATKGDVVVVSGKVYETLGNVAAAIYYADVEVVSKSSGSTADTARRNFNAGLQNALPEPAASFASGLLIGQRSGIAEQWQEVLRRAGLTHIIAVSGYNLTILVRFAKRLFQKRSRYQVLLFSGLLVGLFLLITGFSPSILRAAIVVSLSLTAWYFGKAIRPLTLILLAAAISASFEPFQLWRSVGWYLSFAAFFGVIVLAPLITPRRLLRRDDALAGLVAESVAAQIMTLPIIAFVFQTVTISGFFGNLLIVPFVPLAMLLGLVAGIAGWLTPAYAGWIALPASWLLRMLLEVARVVARLPGTNVTFSLSTVGLFVWYAVVAIFILLLWASRRRAGLRWQEMVQ